jgi:hypothetical protein
MRERSKAFTFTVYYNIIIYEFALGGVLALRLPIESLEKGSMATRQLYCNVADARLACIFEADMP